MDVVNYLDHPNLKHFKKRVAAGSYLFKQGDLGRTMYILIDGIIHLIANRDDSEHVTASLERGQFLGEKAIVESAGHRRVFSAKAKTHATVLEIGWSDIEKIREEFPEILIDMMKHILTISAQRLERAGTMNRILRSSDNYTRLVDVISFMGSSTGRKVPEGTELILTADSISYYIDMDAMEIRAALQELVRNKMLLNKVGDYFVIANEAQFAKCGEWLSQQLSGTRRKAA